MNSILYAASIGTFATWLGFSSASMVGIMVPGRPVNLPPLNGQDLPPIVMTDGEFMDVDTVAGGSAATSEVDEQNNEENVFDQEAVTPEVQEIVPEVAEVTEIEPLPEVPDLPEPKPEAELKPSEDTFALAKKQPAAKPAAKRVETTNRGTNRPVAKRTESGQGTGTGSSGGQGAGAGDRGTGRVSGGRTPRPPYPPLAQKNKIEGTVKVSLTVGEDGYVSDCSIISASDPSLNNSSVILPTLKKWKLPGRRGTMVQSIRFVLK